MCSNIYVKTKLNFNIFLLFLSFFCCSQWIWTQLIKWYSLLNYIFFIYTATYLSLGKKAWSVIWTKLNLLQWTKICFMFSCPSGFWEYFVVNLQRFIQYFLMLNKFFFTQHKDALYTQYENVKIQETDEQWAIKNFRKSQVS